MSKSMAEKIAGWSCQDSTENGEEYAVVLYGVEVIIENLVKTIILIFIGFFLHKMLESFIILFSFCIVRIHAGGIHAKSSLGCTAFMIVVEIIGLIANEYTEISEVICLILCVLSNILIWLYAPNGCMACDLLGSIAKRKKRRYALCSTNILFLLAFCIEIKTLIIIPVFLEALSLLLFEVRRRGENESNKTTG